MRLASRAAHPDLFSGVLRGARRRNVPHEATRITAELSSHPRGRHSNITFTDKRLQSQAAAQAVCVLPLALLGQELDAPVQQLAQGLS
jgi:hypothetical protein